MSLSTARAVSLLALLSIASGAFAQTPPAPTQPPTSAKTPTTKPPAPKPEPKLPANVIARVGNQDISRDQVLAMFDLFNGQPIVDQMVQATLIEQEAKRLGVAVTEAELNQNVKETKDRIVQQQMMMGQPMTFEEIAAKEGFSEGLLRWSVRVNMLRRKAFLKSIGDRLPNRDNQVKLAHILISTVPLPTSPTDQPKPLTPEEKKKKEDDAKVKVDALYADLKSGKIKWEDAVKESEDTSSAVRNGELDYYGPGLLDANFEKAGFAIEKQGDIVGPVKSQYGWHIIKLIQRGKDLPAAEKAAYRKQQEESLLQNPQALQAWQAQLRDKTTVTINRKTHLVPGANKPQPQVTPAKATPPTTKPASGNAKTTKAGGAG